MLAEATYPTGTFNGLKFRKKGRGPRARPAAPGLAASGWARAGPLRHWQGPTGHCTLAAAHATRV